MASALANLSEALASTVSQSDAGVVRVEARRQGAASGIVWSEDGVIVTAHHVLEQESRVQVGLPDGRSVSAALVGRDPTTDLAVLRAKVGDLKPRTWAEPDGLRVGHLVLALGRPGQTVRATLGIVSALGEAWVTPPGGRVDKYVQTDVVMLPGFSGGPLVDSAGRFLGMNTSALLRGVSIALPSPTVRRVVETLLTRGNISRGYLGVGTQPVRLPPSLAMQIGQETGLLIASVAADSPADAGNLLLGDTIIALSGQSIRSIDDLLAFLSNVQVGANIPVRIVRSGQVVDLALTVGEAA